MKIFFVFAALSFIGCNASNEQEEVDETFKTSTLSSLADPGEVKVLDDVYKLAFEAAKATITYEIANARLDAIEAEIQKELDEVAP